ncbi:thioredoxin [Klebsiella indica]|uniref:Thioredoxin n=1 Tax=Klebsiella indica TaxID=2582917 RepID=A0A5R9L8F2_9ENTR|nr:thioredoxin [Klebsiella indica]TLV04998.1 thioredoxin [Klebsiella indica]
MSSEHIQELTPESVDSLLANESLPLLIDLWAPWCGPCQAMAPMLDKLAENTVGKLRVTKLNVDDWPELMTSFRVRSIPTLILFNQGSEHARQVGVSSLTELNQWLRDQGVNVTNDGEEIQLQEANWGAFYNDDALYQLYRQRLEQAAEQQSIIHYLGGQVGQHQRTLAANMVNTDSLETFERATGIPSGLAHCLDQLDIFSSEDVRVLMDALTAGKILDLVPLRFIEQWLQQSHWPTRLTPAVESLRQRWLELTAQYLRGESTALNHWNQLLNELQTQQECTEGQFPISHILCKLLLELSYPPEAAHSDAWLSICIHVSMLQMQLLQRDAGFSDPELLLPEQRWHWINQQMPGDITEMEIEQYIEQKSQQWNQQHEAFSRKETHFFEQYVPLMRSLLPTLRQSLMTIIDSAPVYQPQI